MAVIQKLGSTYSTASLPQIKSDNALPEAAAVRPAQMTMASI